MLPDRTHDPEREREKKPHGFPPLIAPLESSKICARGGRVDPQQLQRLRRLALRLISINFRPRMLKHSCSVREGKEKKNRDDRLSFALSAVILGRLLAENGGNECLTYTCTLYDRQYSDRKHILTQETNV